MKYILTLLITTVFFSFTQAQGGQTYVVNPAKVSELNDYIAAAAPGDVIRFRKGIYTIDKPIVIENKQNLIIQAEDDGVQIVLTDLMEDVIKIKGCKRLSIQGISAKHKEPDPEKECAGSVISIECSAQIWIWACELNGSGAIGVNASGTNDLIVSDCHLHSNSLAAISLRECSFAAIEGCRIENNGSAWFILNSDMRASKNTTQNNGDVKSWSSAFTQEILGK